MGDSLGERDIVEGMSAVGIRDPRDLQLSYPVLKSIVHWWSYEKRKELISQIPGLRTLNKKVPYNIRIAEIHVNTNYSRFDVFDRWDRPITVYEGRDDEKFASSVQRTLNRDGTILYRLQFQNKMPRALVLDKQINVKCILTMKLDEYEEVSDQLSGVTCDVATLAWNQEGARTFPEPKFTARFVFASFLTPNLHKVECQGMLLNSSSITDEQFFSIVMKFIRNGNPIGFKVKRKEADEVLRDNTITYFVEKELNWTKKLLNDQAVASLDTPNFEAVLKSEKLPNGKTSVFVEFMEKGLTRPIQ